MTEIILAAKGNAECNCTPAPLKRGTYLFFCFRAFGMWPIVDDVTYNVREVMYF